MITPGLTEVQSLAHSFSTIPICKSVLADTETPIALYHRLAKHPYSFLLESVEGGEKWSRYSFMGADPLQVITGKDRCFSIKSAKEIQTIMADDPISFLDCHLSQFHSPRYEEVAPFLGGAVGYVSYETVRYFEPNRMITKQNGAASDYDVHLMVFDRLVIFDHLKQKVIFVAHLHVSPEMDEEVLAQEYEKKVRELEKWSKQVLTRNVFISSLPDFDLEERELEHVTPNMSPQDFMRQVEDAKEYIRAGDIFQVVLSQRWTVEKAPEPMNVYRVLRVLNPSPYMYYLRMGEETIVGSSPELLVRVTDRQADIRPIAGSRPRGKNKLEEEKWIADLLSDEKERAEHVMLVDLGRNDVGRVARVGTVNVTSYMQVEKYSHIMHLVSHVKAELAEHHRPLTAFQACFPAGTVSGAPKIRAMEIIAELEPEPRGIYAGGIGYFSFTGNLDSCIAIRTIYFRDGKASVQAGAGIVADSVPEKEYWETVNKAKGMLRALQIANQSNRVGGSV